MNSISQFGTYKQAKRVQQSGAEQEFSGIEIESAG